MMRLITLTCLILFSCIIKANQQSLYQIDMIVFSHQQSSAIKAENTATPVVAPNTQNAIFLESSTNNTVIPYHLLPKSLSQLTQASWALNHKPDYKVLAHYTWLQPSNNQRAIAIPSINQSGWSIEGTVRVRQSNYYLLETDLLFSSPSKKAQTAFLFTQKQRLKPGTTYYLDHPQAGMLIKVHKIA